MAFRESNVRDSLAQKLSLIEEGLRLEKKEQYVPSSIGTRSFIDLVAQDQHGRIVLIEVKKDNGTAREALHEILKYIEAVKLHLGLREDEIRVFVASSEWRELYVPFSSFVARTSCSVTGLLLKLSSKGDVDAIEPVVPMPSAEGRLIAPWHEVCYYSEVKDADEALKNWSVSCASKGIDSYVILELRPADQTVQGLPSPKQASMHEVIASIAGGHVQRPAMALYKRVLYFAMQQLSDFEYENALDKLGADEETMEYIGELEDEEKLGAMHEALLDLQPRPENDFFEIGYPAKLKSRLLEEDGWTVATVHRFGAFQRNARYLSDETILEEVCGSEGVTSQRFVRTFDPKDKSQLAEAKKGIERCLSDNKAWRKQIIEVIDETVELKSADSADISIFNPSTGLLTFYLAVSRPNGEGYIPEYHIQFRHEEVDTLIFGCLVWDGSKVSFDTVLSKHYESSVSLMLHPLLWGGYDSQDAAVMRTIGFRYKTYRVDVRGDSREFFHLTGDGWEECEEVHPFGDFKRIYEKNEELMREVCELYSNNWSGGIVDLSELS